MDTKRASALRHHGRNKIDKLAENDEIELKEIDYDKKQKRTKKSQNNQTKKI